MTEETVNKWIDKLKEAIRETNEEHIKQIEREEEERQRQETNEEKARAILKRIADERFSEVRQRLARQ